MNIVNKGLEFVSNLPRNIKTAAAATGAVVVTTLGHAQATVPTDVQPMIDGASATWTAVKAVIVGVVLFGIAIAFAKRLKKG